MKSLLVLCVAFGVFSTQADGSCIAEGDRNPNGVNVTKQSISDAILKYTLDQYKTMIAQNGKDNLFTSPLSIWTALANTYLGSRGESSAQLGTVLGLKDYDKVEVEKAMLEFAENVVSKTGDRFLVANKLAFNDRYKIRDCLNDEQFLDAANFSGEPEPERKRLNAWVMSKTEDKINNLLPPTSIDSLTLLVILNAVYFKGSWQTEFNKALTSQQSFHSQNGNINNVDMMQRKEGKTLFYYCRDQTYTAVDLPYSSGKYAMSIVLPASSQTVDSVLNDMTTESMQKMFNGFHNSTLRLLLPKFKLERSYELTKALQQLGATEMFKHIDVSGIFESAVGGHVSNVFHKAFVSVDEEGTEAAAATAVVITESLPPTFAVNRPFITIIREIKTSTIMFVGVVRNL